MEGRYLITEYKGKRAAFLLEEGKLMRALPLENSSLIGNVYTAKVVNIVPSINAAFLDAGTGDYLYYSLADNEGKHIFLHHGNTNKVCTGDEMLVQVSKDPVKTKKGVCSSSISLKGHYVVIDRSGEIGVSKKITDAEKRQELRDTLSKVLGEFKDYGVGAIVRTAAEKEDIEVVTNEAKSILCKLKEIMDSSLHMLPKQMVYAAESGELSDVEEVVKKKKYTEFEIVTDIRDVYEQLMSAQFIKDSEDNVKVSLFEDKLTNLSLVYSLETKLEKGFSRSIYLKSGGSIVVEPTEAMTVIDVNTGKAVKGKDTEKTFLKINIEAAAMIARVLRLRNISGIIIIDFISMKNSDSIRELINILQKELLKDENKVTYVDITPLGLVEMTRKKVSRPLTLDDFSL